MHLTEQQIELIVKRAGELAIDSLKMISLKSLAGCPEGSSFINDYVKENILPHYSSVIVAAMNYNYSWNNASAEATGYIAHYTSANFYKILFMKLKELAQYIKRMCGDDSSDRNSFRIFVNTLSFNEKLLAALAGLGKYSRNTLLSIAPDGQKSVIGELFIGPDIACCGINARLELNEMCRNCSLCIDKCPTGALRENFTVDKNFCLQHLSGELNWGTGLDKTRFVKLWGERFFGCTDCIDCCPGNSSITTGGIDKCPPGYLGIFFDLEEIPGLKKDDYKKRFAGNQLGASWIDPLCILRNALMALYNLGKTSLVEDYISESGNLGWNSQETGYLKDFFDFL